MAEARAENGGAIGSLIRQTGDEPATSNPTADKLKNSNSPYILNDEVLNVKIKVNRFDYPVVANATVEKWVTYFTGKGRKYFAKYLERGRYFIPEIAKVLKQNNMPQDLVYLAMIESGFNNSARSHAKAVGPWQFIKGTGTRYGLKVNYWLDERRDTRRATMAAIAYLRELYQEFDSWELSAAAYNAGEGKVRRAISKYKTHNFWEIAKHKFFKRETRDYVPKIMAAAIISKNPEMFGFEDPFQRGSKPISNPTTLLLAEDEEATDEEPTPKELNEEIAKVEDSKEETIEDPADASSPEEIASAGDADNAEDDKSDDHAVVFNTPHPTLTPSLYMVANPNERIIEFEIKGPVDLLNVSKAAGIPYSSLKMLNPELLRWCTPPSMKSYRLKLPLSAKDRFLSTYNENSFDRKVVFQQYGVKKGDTVSKLAKKFLVESEPIREINQFPNKTEGLRVGNTILLPLPTGYKRVIASMYDEKPSYGKAKRSRSRTKRYRARARVRKSTSTGYNSSSRIPAQTRHLRVPTKLLAKEAK